MEGQPKMVFPFVIGNEYVPDIGKKIFNLLNHKTLSKVRVVSKEWKHEVDQETSFWSDISPDTYRKAVRQALPSERMDIIRNLVDYAQDPNPANEAGKTLLHEAAAYGRVEVCKLLLEHCAKKNPRDDIGWTPLHHAALHGRVEVCKVLLEDGADKDPRDNDGRTPMHWAAIFGEAEVCKVLLQNGADKNLRDDDGRTPLDHARSTSETEMEGLHLIMPGRQDVIALLSQ